MNTNTVKENGQKAWYFIETNYFSTPRGPNMGSSSFVLEICASTLGSQLQICPKVEARLGLTLLCC